VESTPAFRETVLLILLGLGGATILRENAEMYRHGMAECTIDGTTIAFRMSDRCSVDHFLDRLEEDKLRRLEDSMPGDKLFREVIAKTTVENLDERTRALVAIAHYENAGPDRLRHTTVLVQQYHLGVTARSALYLGKTGHLIVAACLNASREGIVGSALPRTYTRRSGRGRIHDMIRGEDEVKLGPVAPMSLLYA